MDERVRSIDDIIQFYRGGEFSDISTAQAERIRDRITEDYDEWRFQQRVEDFDRQSDSLIRDWIYENEIDEDEELEEYLTDQMKLTDDQVKEALKAGKHYGKRITSLKLQKETREEVPAYDNFLTALNAIDSKISKRVEEAIEEHNDIWDRAEEEFMEDDDGSEYDESDWLRSGGINTAQDIEGQYDLYWPYMYDTNENRDDNGEFNTEYAETLADSLEKELGVETTVSDGYHSTTRDDTTWIFEPDSSLEANDSDDMPVEIVTPPLPLEQAVEILPKFFEWVKSHDGYVNKSTGFHMSVSMPDHDMNNLDYTKLALFLGDEYVLKQFGRDANNYAVSALSKIKDRASRDPDQVAEYLEKMKDEMNSLAKLKLASSQGFGKYTSINPKNGYVEFRSAGGENYMDDMKRLQDTLTRYGMALSIAMDPEAERQEYAKKLYKLLSSITNDNSDIIKIFSQYSSGKMSVSELKSHLEMLQRERNGKTQTKDSVSNMPPLDHDGNYEIYSVSSDSSIYPFRAWSPDEAMEVLSFWRSSVMVPRLDPSNFSVRSLRQVSRSSAPATDDRNGNYILRRREGNEGVGPILYRFSAISGGEAVEMARRWTVSRGIDRRSVYLDSISSLSSEELRAISEPARSSISDIPDIDVDIEQNFTS